MDALDAGAADPLVPLGHEEREVAALGEGFAVGAVAGLLVVDFLLGAPEVDGFLGGGVPVVVAQEDALAVRVARVLELAVPTDGGGPAPRVPRHLLVPPQGRHAVARPHHVVGGDELPGHALVRPREVGGGHHPLRPPPLPGRVVQRLLLLLLLLLRRVYRRRRRGGGGWCGPGRLGRAGGGGGGGGVGGGGGGGGGGVGGAQLREEVFEGFEEAGRGGRRDAGEEDEDEERCHRHQQEWARRHGWLVISYWFGWQMARPAVERPPLLPTSELGRRGGPVRDRLPGRLGGRRREGDRRGGVRKPGSGAQAL
ncbi:hypothetical protein PAHAL_3G152100 [Panicum hallii]|uniref:Uncharacterized protein n=1 Tax=Panicum hallii TaxID=206008 RepID=A0A2T8KI90_9POAL|nr:hypothetical protein PAHAL_3G152100 [Panicum hallii]